MGVQLLPEELAAETAPHIACIPASSAPQEPPASPEPPAPQHCLHLAPPAAQNNLQPSIAFTPSITYTQRHLHPGTTCISSITCTPASPAPQHHLHRSIACIPASPASWHHLHPSITSTPASWPAQIPTGRRSPQLGGARGYLGGWEPRGASWHCRMMLRMSCVGRGKCSEFSREFCTSSPGHRRPTGAVGPSTRLTGGQASSSPLLLHHNGTPYQLSARRVVAGGRGLASPLLLCPARDTMPWARGIPPAAPIPGQQLRRAAPQSSIPPLPVCPTDRGTRWLVGICLVLRGQSWLCICDGKGVELSQCVLQPCPGAVGYWVQGCPPHKGPGIRWRN